MNKLYLLSYGSFYNYKYPNEQTNTMNGGKLRPVDFNKTVDRDSLRLQWVSYQLGKRESRADWLAITSILSTMYGIQRNLKIP